MVFEFHTHSCAPQFITDKDTTSEKEIENTQLTNPIAIKPQNKLQTKN